MKRIAIVLAVVLAASFVTAWAQAEEVEIVELKTFTTDYDGIPETVFDVWDPVMYEVTYKIIGGTVDYEYKAVIVIKSMRDILKEVEYHTYQSDDTEYTTRMLNMAGSGDVGDKTVRYKAKLKDGSTLLDRDRYTTQITVNEP